VKSTPTIAVVGGGITGLAAARSLATAPDAPRVVLFEADSRLGGKLRTNPIEDTIVESGADWFVTRPSWAVDLCRALDLGDRLIEPATSGALVWSRGRLRALPEGFVRGVPVAPIAAVRAGLLSLRGALRALGDLVMPGPLTGDDVSVGALVRRRFGNEVAEQLVDPMVAAARAGSIDELSLRAATPDLDEVARTRRSVILGLRAQSHATADEGPRFLGLDGGMDLLVERLHAAPTGVEVHTGAAVRAVSHSDAGYELRLDGETLAVDGVVLAVPAFAAAPLVASLSPRATEELSRIEYADAAVVTLVYPPGAGPYPGRGSGWLVPTCEHKTMTACAFYSAKWPTSAPTDGGIVLRCFVGRGGREPALDLDDGELVAILAAEVNEATGITPPPRAWSVARWDKGLPVYAVGHLERVALIEKELEPWPSLALAGAGYRGSGIPDCIRQGEDAARKVLLRIDARLG
jgi:oxygen-dependent protoporphyrinogen oxidase